VHVVDELGLLPSVVDDADVAAGLKRRYLAPLDAVGGIRAELLHTVRVYLASGRRREATADALFIHPNTVGYRIGRFVAVTGADLDDTTVVAELWWLFHWLDANPRPS
jgi:DNA-binding PucR family transcriptional regulator